MDNSQPQHVPGLRPSPSPNLVNACKENGNMYEGASPSIMHNAFYPNSRPVPQNHMPMRLVHWSQLPYFVRSPNSNPQLHHRPVPFPMEHGILPPYRPSTSPSIVGTQLHAHSNELAVEHPLSAKGNNTLRASLKNKTVQNIEMPVTQKQSFGMGGNVSFHKSEYSTNSEHTNFPFNYVNADKAGSLNSLIVGDYTVNLNSDLSANLITNSPTELKKSSTDVSHFCKDAPVLTNGTHTASTDTKSIERPDITPVTGKDAKGEQVLLAERYQLGVREYPCLDDVAYEIEVKTTKDPQLQMCNETRLDYHSEGSDDLARSSGSNSENNVSVTIGNKPDSGPVKPPAISGGNSVMNIKMATGVQEKVVKAARALFTKRARTIHRWLYQETTEKQMKATLNSAWDSLPENEKRIYVSQVLGRFGLHEGHLMINPLLNGIKGLSSDPIRKPILQGTCVQKSKDKSKTVEGKVASFGDRNGRVSYPEPQAMSEDKHKKKRSYPTMHPIHPEDDQTDIAKRLHSAPKCDQEFQDEAELRTQMKKFVLCAEPKSDQRGLQSI